MKRIAIAALGIFALVGAIACSLPPDNPREAIESILRAQEDAWNSGDLETFCSYYDEQTLFLSTSGVSRGRLEVLSSYQRNYPDQAAMGKLSLEVIDIRLLHEDPKWAQGVSVAARWSLDYGDEPSRSGLTGIVFTRVGDRWLIVQDVSL